MQKSACHRGCAVAGSEWAAICKSGALRDLYCYVRFDCQAEVRRQAQHRKALFQVKVRQDGLRGSGKGFRAVKAPPLTPLLALPVVETQQGTFPSAFQRTVALLDEATEVTVKGEVEDPDVPGSTLLLIQSSTHEPFVQGFLSQHTAAATPPELDRKFQDCWYPILR